MGKVDCFTLDGINMWFWSKDHNPPHFHAEKPGKWEVKVKFLESTKYGLFEVEWSEAKSIPKSDLKQLSKMVVMHRDNLLMEWEAKVDLQ